MVVGIGTDILNIGRMKTILSAENKNSFLKKTFTDEECDQAELRDDKTLYYASRFCGKEAVFKTLGAEDIRLNEIEILNDKNGTPYVTLYREALRKSRELKSISEIDISLSSDTDYVVAFAVAIRKD